jgi:hypothetical protein
MGRACSTNGKKRNAYRILMGKLEGKRSQGRPRRRWVNNVKMDLTYDRVVWIGLMWLRYGSVEGSCEHSSELSGSIKCWEVLE